MPTTTTAPAVRLPFETPNEYFDHRHPDAHYAAAITAVWSAAGLSHDDRLKISDLIRAVATESWSKGYRDHAESHRTR